MENRHNLILKRVLSYRLGNHPQLFLQNNPKRGSTLFCFCIRHPTQNFTHLPPQKNTNIKIVKDPSSPPRFLPNHFSLPLNLSSNCFAFLLRLQVTQLTNKNILYTENLCLSCSEPVFFVVNCALKSPLRNWAFSTFRRDAGTESSKKSLPSSFAKPTSKRCSVLEFTWFTWEKIKTLVYYMLFLELRAFVLWCFVYIEWNFPGKTSITKIHRLKANLLSKNKTFCIIWTNLWFSSCLHVFS